MTKRKIYEPKFKAQVVIECLKEEKTISQIASDYQVLSGMISKWKSTRLLLMCIIKAKFDILQ
jgi:transposase-like protein